MSNGAQLYLALSLIRGIQKQQTSDHNIAAGFMLIARLLGSSASEKVKPTLSIVAAPAAESADWGNHVPKLEGFLNPGIIHIESDIYFGEEVYRKLSSQEKYIPRLVKDIEVSCKVDAIHDEHHMILPFSADFSQTPPFHTL
ncbi:hypothetical protein R3P38DRAFT_2774397 [Favolaschia claudopus]|uniref:Uncharacterized protein n=1 Tax=Favolaschia claudopus TaxID=2862362 RepID=A0AAW0BXS0_9AGAR